MRPAPAARCDAASFARQLRLWLFERDNDSEGGTAVRGARRSRGGHGGRPGVAVVRFARAFHAALAVARAGCAGDVLVQHTAPGSPAHARTFAGDGRARRDDVQAALDAHVAALGPPHTLVLTGAEGSGRPPSSRRSSRLLGVRRGDVRDVVRRRARDTSAASRRLADSPRRRRSRAAPSFVLAHSFADQSFSQDVAHFLEKSCPAPSARSRSASHCPRTPRTFRALAAFFEHAAMFRRVLVVVDAVEGARVAPYASYAAAAVAGVDPRERAKHARGEIPADRRAHVAWLPQSPPLAVRFILAARDDAGYAGDDRCLDASRTVVAAVVSRAPASTTVFEMLPLTTPLARILAGASPAPVGAAEAKSHGALDRGHHRGEVMAEAIRAKCATPGYARAVAPFAPEATSRTRHSAWVVAGAGEEAEYRGEVAAETHELPKSVAQALANLSNAPGGVAARAFVDAEERFGVDATSAVATCLACARFGLTRDELKAAATRRVRAQHARAEQHAKARREDGAEDWASAEASASASASAEASARASKYARARRRSTKVSTRSSRRFDRGSRRGVRATRGRARWNPSTRTRTTTTRRLRTRNRVLSRSRRRSSKTPRPRKFKFRARFATRTRARRLWNDTRPQTRWIPSTARAFDDVYTRTSPRISYPFPITYA